MNILIPMAGNGQRFVDAGYTGGGPTLGGTMNILIPMAGNGQRFVDAGYTEPKPFIDVLGKPMIERVIENLGGPSAGNFVFVVQAPTHKFNPIPRLRGLVPGCTIVTAKEPTAGAACTALLAAHLIDTDEPLLIANSDQIVEFAERAYEMNDADGVIYTFAASHPKWSYVAVDRSFRVWGVAEKQVISDQATCGIYWFRRGVDFVRAARQMIDKNLRVNNELYIAPVFNQMIARRAFIEALPVWKMHGLGTPEDLEAYIRHERSKEGTRPSGT